MNPAPGSEVRDRAAGDVRAFIDCLDRAGSPVRVPPVLRGDVREAYVAAFCAELMAAEGVTPKRLKAAMGVA